MTNKCMYKKPDGVCCEHDKREHKGVTFQNSEYGWDNSGYCMVDNTFTDTSGMCKLYDIDDED